MTCLTLLGAPALVALMALFALFSCAGAVQGALEAERDPRPSLGIRACGALLCAAWLCGAFFASCVLRGEPWVALPFDARPISAALYPTLGLACVMGPLARAVGNRRPAALAEPAGLALWMLCALVPEKGGAGWALFSLACAALAAAGAGARLLRLRRRLTEEPSLLSLAATVSGMPEGVAYASESGRMLLVNDAMRGFLGRLGLSADLASVEAAGARVREAALDRDEDAPLLVPVPWEGREAVWAVDVASVRLGGTPCLRILGMDVTEEVELERRSEQVARELEQASDRLQDTLEQVRETARAEAAARMRQRVHDVIGQRLSLLHRLLEDDGLDDARVEQVRPLITDILRDLREPEEVAWQDELDAVVQAFGLVGVEVQVQGRLPQQEALAALCVQVAREGATNAVRHGHATQVRLRLQEGADGFGIEVGDNGVPTAQRPWQEGRGIGGMRREAETLGGGLTVEAGPPFVVRVSVPWGRRTPPEPAGAHRAGRADADETGGSEEGSSPCAC